MKSVDKKDLIRDIKSVIKDLRDSIKDLQDSPQKTVVIYGNTDNGGYSDDSVNCYEFGLSVGVDDEDGVLIFGTTYSIESVDEDDEE